jgi:hypothetical protein
MATDNDVTDSELRAANVMQAQRDNAYRRPPCAQRGPTSAESRDQFGNALTFCTCDDTVKLSVAKVIPL